MKGRMKEKMKRREMKEKIIFSKKNVSEPSNPPEELAQNVSKKIPSDELFLHFFFRKCRIWPFLNYLHDSNSIFWAQGIKSELFFGRTVLNSTMVLKRGED